MKSREEFISDIFEKAEAVRAKEAKDVLLRKKRRKAVGAIAAAAACVMIAVGVGTFGEGGLLDGQQMQDPGESTKLYAENPAQYGEAAGETNETGENNSAEPTQTDSTKEADSSASIPGGGDKADSVKNAGSTGNTDSADNSSNAGSRGSSFSASSRDDSKSIKGSSTSEHVISYFCMPARIVAEDAEGSRTIVAEDDLQAIFEKIQELSAQGKAVSAALGAEVPVSDFSMKYIYVTHAENDENENVLWDDDNEENTVWYIIE